MSRLEKARRARQLYDSGLTGIEVAAEMGISRAYAYGLLNDPDGSQDKARKRSYGGRCESCGASTDGSNGRYLAPRFCKSCLNDQRFEEASEHALSKLREWIERYGKPPTAMDWNPNMAIAVGRSDLAKRFQTGDWPHVSSMQNLFGSWANFFEAAGLPRPEVGRGSGRRYPGDDPAVREEAVRLYASGLSSYRVAKRLGCGANSVLRWVHEAGVARTYEEAWELRRAA